MFYSDHSISNIKPADREMLNMGFSGLVGSIGTVGCSPKTVSVRSSKPTIFRAEPEPTQTHEITTHRNGLRLNGIKILFYARNVQDYYIGRDCWYENSALSI